MALTVAGVIAGVGVLVGVGALIAATIHSWREAIEAERAEHG